MQVRCNVSRPIGIDDLISNFSYGNWSTKIVRLKGRLAEQAQLFGMVCVPHRHLDIEFLAKCSMHSRSAADISCLPLVYVSALIVLPFL